MRVVSLHSDVLLATSRIWQTTCTIVRGGDEAFVIDSPVLPDELELLPAVIEQSRFPQPAGLLATHADWDHLLGRLAFPEAALGCAASTMERMRATPGEAQRELRAFDDEHYLVRPAPLALGSVQALDAPGACEIGPHELALHPAEGHTGEGMAIWAPWAGVLVVGDYLSPVEIPVLGDGGSLEAYAATLDRLRPLVAEAQFVVPGHGTPLGSKQALALMDEDLAYLEALRTRDGAAELPDGRRGKAQRAIHVANAEHILDRR